MSAHKTGFILGKFMPFHAGHQFLIESARQQCDHLTVLVCTLPEEPIPGWQRYAWVKNTFPDLDVRHVTDLNPPDPAQHHFFWEIWCNTILRNTPEKPEVFFSSDNFGATLAAKLGTRHIMIDPERKQTPVSSTDIRRDPQAHWQYLPAEVRPYYIKRVALLGPESCGKTYMTEYLARHFDTCFVEEYGRTYCEKFGMELTPLDFAHIAGGQLYREDEMAKQANKILFCDTDLIVTQSWSEVYFNGACQPWILWANHLRRYDLMLLMKPDIPWENDGLREYAHTRTQQFERLQAELESRNQRFAIISGGYEERSAMAVREVEEMKN